MAKSDTTEQSPTPDSADIASPHIDEARRLACLEAVWEISALAHVLPGHVPPDEFHACLVIRGLSARIATLAGQLMNGLGDAKVTTEQIKRVTTFRPGWMEDEGQWCGSQQAKTQIIGA